MMNKILGKVFGSRNERTLRRLNKIVQQINALEPAMQALSAEAVRAKTQEFRARLAENPASQRAVLAEILPEAFALVREASRRVLGLRHFDAQLIGGMALHEGKIAEMRTGEGKTLMATLSAYLNALPAQGVHIVTVNDYLAERDAEWMRPVFEFLGLSVSVILNNMPQEDKRAAYAADITYGTNNEFGFDYLRDNMAFALEDRVQRALSYAIVDEVDSILIDEARTPLIISGIAEDSSQLYISMNALVPRLKLNEDYTVDEKARQVHLTEAGHQHVENLMLETGLLAPEESLYHAKNIMLMHHLNAALRAHTLFQRDVDYIVQNNQVVIVDEHTGRTMPGRRWSDGLHQAVEARENVPIQNENQTLASITFQNYFRMYEKLAGMTGTADTEAYEFQQIYGLEVVVIPTNKPVKRVDHPDQIYLTATEKFRAIIADIKDCEARGQPVLVGTASIETSEYLSGLLTQEKIAHQVLNAKFHAQEAEIIANAGRVAAVTIATNMAGRGTDIVLGGKLMGENAAPENQQEWQKAHEAVVAAGGLHIIGSERHESRRIDNQLRGRSGRQGDPGSTRFYLSLQDNLMRIFAAERLANIMQRLGMRENEAIVSPLVSRAIESAQRKVEARNFDIRKQLLEYDDVANEQRKVIYAQRTELMAAENIADTVESIRVDVINSVIDKFIPPQSLDEQWDVAGLQQYLAQDFGAHLPLQKWLDEDDNLHEEGLRERIVAEIAALYAQKEQQAGAEVLRQLEKSMMLQQLDILWKEHLAAMDHLRQGIHLRGYAQKNPKQEYKREAFALFTDMLENLKYQLISLLSLVEIRTPDAVQMMEEQLREQARQQKLQMEHAAFAPLIDNSAAETADQSGQQNLDVNLNAPMPIASKTGRNQPCPCGSGKKFKQCHGQLA